MVGVSGLSEGDGTAGIPIYTPGSHYRWKLHPDLQFSFTFKPRNEAVSGPASFLLQP